MARRKGFLKICEKKAGFQKGGWNLNFETVT
jgi:hypothetical protein